MRLNDRTYESFGLQAKCIICRKQRHRTKTKTLFWSQYRKLKDLWWGEMITPFGQRKREIKENKTFIWERYMKPDLQMLSRPTPLWRELHITFLKHPCVPSCRDRQARLWGNVPPGLLRIGCGAPVKHAGRGSGLISATKWGDQVLNPWRCLRTEMAGAASQSQELTAQSCKLSSILKL